jgi:hypothetical protein
MAHIQAAAMAAEAEPEFVAEPVAEAAPEPADVDPRLQALGQMQAEAAAAESTAQADSGVDEIPELDEAALVARLGSVVPSHPAAPATTSAVLTQVVVGGLVSVASIASFKRHLGRFAGVSHVGVSSGPEGEFIFNVQHLDTVALRDLIPALPGFRARVTGEGAGTLVVAARDPES